MNWSLEHNKDEFIMDILNLRSYTTHVRAYCKLAVCLYVFLEQEIRVQALSETFSRIPKHEVKQYCKKYSI
jgi:hypothetical protein